MYADTGVDYTYNPLTDYILPALFIVLIVGVIGFVVWLLYSKLLLKKAVTEAAELMILQVLVPKEEEPKEEAERRKNFQETMAIAEQCLASLSAIAHVENQSFIKNPPTISLEIAAKDAIRFYIGFPKKYRDLVEKQILAYYPTAAIEESADHRIFDNKLQGVGAEFKLARRFVLPIKTYKELESDPLNNITEVFSKLGLDSRGALQVLLRPTTENWQHQVYGATRAVQENRAAHMLADSPLTRAWLWIMHSAQSAKNKEEQQRQPMTPMQEETLKDLNEKSAKIGYQAQFRVVVMAPTYAEAMQNLGAIKTAFAQFTSPRGNSFKMITARNFKQFATMFILRAFNASKNQILNTEEISSVFHLPNRFTTTPKIQWLLARTVPPPINLPAEGIVIGKSVYRGEEKLVRLTLEDRRKHMYMIGKTGVGKTTLLTKMFMQDVQNGVGCAYLDPNGDAVENILSMIPPERADDVIMFDPSDVEWPMGLNMLEWKRPEDRDFLVAEWLAIFQKLFDPNNQGMVGPQFEHWGRNASLTVMSIPGGGTLIDIPRLFVDDNFQKYCVSHVTDPVVKSFWDQQMAKTSDFHKSEMYNYFISKFGRFMTNDLMRNVIGQTKSSFDFREAMDSGKILLVNLSKGKIGEMNSYMLGMILVSKLQVAAFQRADTPEEQRRDFFLYIDEFQNFTTGSIKTILSEARKYRLGLNITNQYIAQLPEDIRDAVIGNAGTLLAYRVGAPDAEFLEKEFPGVSKEDLTNLLARNLYAKLLIDGNPSKPFSVTSIKTDFVPNQQVAEATRQLCRLKYAKPATQVESELDERLAAGSDMQEPKPVDNMRLA